MGFLRTIIALILNILFPTGFYYEPVTESRADEESRMTTDRSRRAPPGSPRSPLPEPQPRRRSVLLSRNGRISDGETASNRRSRYQIDFEHVQQTYTRRKSRNREDQSHRGRDGSHRNLPSPTRVHREETRGQPQSSAVDRTERVFRGECSETDIIRHCRSLNQKIDSTALSLVDAWARYPSISRRRLSLFWSDSDDTRTDYLQDAIGSALYNSIKSARSYSPSDEVRNLVTDALRASAIFTATYIISTRFCPKLSLERDDEMRRIFRNMLRGEPLATALRWRALTYEHSVTAGESVTNEYQRMLIGYVRAIFVAAVEKNPSRFLSSIPTIVKESKIIESALELSEMLKAKIFSVLLDVYTVQPGTIFHEEAMDVDSNRPTRNRPVLCTLEIGLRDCLPQNGQTRILLKPKVALE